MQWLQRIVPLLVCLITLQNDPTLRESLIHCLLEIKKRPTIEDRSIILSGNFIKNFHSPYFYMF